MPPALTPVTHGKELPVNKISGSLTLGDDDETGLDNAEKDVDGTGHDTNTYNQIQQTPFNNASQIK